MEEVKKFVESEGGHFGLLSQEEWEKKGRPATYVVVASFRDYTLLEDIAYGGLVLLKEGKKVDQGQDFVRSPDGSVVGLSEYFGTPGLYRRIKDVEERR